MSYDILGNIEPFTVSNAKRWCLDQNKMITAMETMLDAIFKVIMLSRSEELRTHRGFQLLIGRIRAYNDNNHIICFKSFPDKIPAELQLNVTCIVDTLARLNQKWKYFIDAQNSATKPADQFVSVSQEEQLEVWGGPVFPESWRKKPADQIDASLADEVIFCEGSVFSDSSRKNIS